MRIFETVRPGKVKRKRPPQSSPRGSRALSGELAPGKQGTVTAARLCTVVFLVVAVAFCGPYAWKSSGASSEEVGRKFGFRVQELDGRRLASNLVRAMKTIRINAFLSSRQSPLAGMGGVFLDAERETGVSAELVAAITLAESSCATDGALSLTNHNAWGMKGPQPALGIPAEGGYCWWPDWTAAIHGAARFIAHYWGAAKTAVELKGYACGAGSWVGTVEGTRQAIIKG